MSTLEIIAQKGHHDTRDFGQEEVGRIQPDPALPRNTGCGFNHGTRVPRFCRPPIPFQ
jgi:hypothetical protein